MLVRSVRSGFSAVPWSAIGLVLLVAILGIYNLNSAAAAREPNHLYLTQLVVLLVGMIGVGIVLVPDYRVSEGLAYPLYAVVCVLLVAVLLQGYSAGGARRWLVLGPIRFQPSELAKLAVIFCLARYFGHRIEPHGYSMRSLFRPFNPSRPLVAGAVVAAFWDKEWLRDPVGSIARFLSQRVGYPAPRPDDTAWFRICIVTLLLGASVLAVVLIFRAERRQALLYAWPAHRRRNLLIATGLVFSASVLVIASAWSNPWMRDPFGVLIAKLADAAGPGGRYEAVSSSLFLRTTLAVSVGLYAIAALRKLWASRPPLSEWLIAPVDLLGLPALLILIEPDLGTAGIVVLIGFSMILVVGVRLRSLIVLSALGALGALVGWFGVLKDYQKRRILTFMDPEGDIQGAGWNAVQSMIAVGSGRLWGKGHRGGTQTQLSFLPEQHTDFAFSVWAEEHGFMGCVFLLALFVMLLLFVLNVAAEAREPYGALLAVGVAALLFWQTVINVGMVIGLMPVVGMTLPLFSYGGSSLLSVLIGLGLVLSVHLRKRA